jgi:N-methylhydantoinase A
LSKDEPLEPDFDQAVSDRFHAAHDTRFGHANPGAPVEFVVVRSMALGDLGRIDPVRQNGASDASYPSTTAEVTFGRRPQPTAMIQRGDLPVGAVVDGPAIVSEATATTVVPPGATLRVDPFGSLVIAVGEEQ